MSNRSFELGWLPARWRAHTCLIMLILIPALFVGAAEDPPRPEGANSKGSKANVERLVKLLGDPSFTVRENATQSLAELGILAQQGLKRALVNPDLEIRMRAHRILLKSLQSEFAAKIAAFISDVDSKEEHDLPGWKQFRKTIGSDRNARILFAEMLRRESGILEAFDTGKNLEPVLSKRLAELRPGNAIGQVNGPQQAHPATLAALLFVAAESKLSTNTTLFSQFYTLLNYSSNKRAIQGSRHNDIIMKTLSQLVLKETSKTSHYYPIRLTLNYDMKTTGLTLGRRLLKSRPASFSTIQYAAIAVARFGDQNDISLLVPHLTNVSVCHTWSNPQIQPGVIKTQVRDVILALLIHLTKQDHKEYGFELLRTTPTTLFHTYTCGFTKEEKREAAQAKWKTWYEKNKPK